MATVASLLSESTTTISSAQATDFSASPMSVASFLVMTVTDSFGTEGECTLSAASDDSAGLQRAVAGGGDAADISADRDFLDGLEVDERLVVIRDRLKLGRAGEREIPLRLQDEERRPQTRRQLLLFRLELLLLQIGRASCRERV